jgi:hypothetical protein
MIRVVDGRYQSRRLADRWLSMNRLPYQLQLDNLRDLEPNHRQCHCNTRCHIQRRCCVRYKSKDNALHIEQQEIIELLKDIEVHFEGDQVSDAGTETLPQGEDLDVCDVRNGSAWLNDYAGWTRRLIRNQELCPINLKTIAKACVVQSQKVW